MVFKTYKPYFGLLCKNGASLSDAHLEQEPSSPTYVWTKEILIKEDNKSHKITRRSLFARLAVENRPNLFRCNAMSNCYCSRSPVY